MSRADSSEAAMQRRDSTPLPSNELLAIPPLRRLWQTWGVLWLALAFLGGTAFILWLLARQADDLYEAMAIHGAALQAQTLSEMRKAYTSEVVDRLKEHGIQAGADYRDRPKTIPLPVTLTM